MRSVQKQIVIACLGVLLCLSQSACVVWRVLVGIHQTNEDPYANKKDDR